MHDHANYSSIPIIRVDDRQRLFIGQFFVLLSLMLWVDSNFGFKIFWIFHLNGDLFSGLLIISKMAK